MASARWVADSRIRWRILLTAVPARSVTEAELVDRLERLCGTQGWAPPAAIRHGNRAALLSELAEVAEEPLAVGLDGRCLVLSAHHAHVDGMGLLAVLGELVGTDLESSSRGIGERASSGSFLSGALRRLGEVALTPPAKLALPPEATGTGDVFAEREIEGSPRTGALVHAAVRAVVEHNEAAHRPSRHVAVAVGAAAPTTTGEALGNHSVLLRLRDLENDSAEEVDHRLRTTPVDHAGGAGPPGGAVARAAVRLLAPRLGSTLLVSHLGSLTGADLSAAAFYPVTAGGTGLSLGGVTVAARTTVTLRGRAATWTADGLDDLLARVTGHLS